MTEDKARLLEATWNYELTQIFSAVIKKKGQTGFTADDIFREIRESKSQLPPTYVSRHIGAMFRSFKAAGYIKKDGTYSLSERNGSSPLPRFVSTKSDVVQNHN